MNLEIVADDKGTLLYCTSESSDIFTVQMCPDAPKVSEQHLVVAKLLLWWYLKLIRFEAIYQVFQGPATD